MKLVLTALYGTFSGLVPDGIDGDGDATSKSARQSLRSYCKGGREQISETRCEKI